MVNYISVMSESSEHGGLNLLSGNAGSSPSLVLPVTACSEFTRSTDYINAGNCTVSNKGCNCIQQIHQLFTKIIGPATNQALLGIERSNSRAALALECSSAADERHGMVLLQVNNSQQKKLYTSVMKG